MPTDNAWWFAAGAIVIVLLAAWLVTTAVSRRHAAQRGAVAHRFGRRRPTRQHFRPEGSADATVPLRRAAIIVNPTKLDDVGAARAQISRRCTDAGWGEPIWLETTVEDPGTGQARRAIEEGAAVVCPLGGDGTVRSVASALVGTDTPLGLLGGGTGNLLARNLNVAVDSLDEALRVALTGRNKRVDVARLSVSRTEHGQPEEHIFLVMAGLGFDAAVMADAPEKLKRKVGPLAYGFSGMKNLRGPRFKVRVTVDDAGELTRRVRTVVIGNCGRLTAGLVLLPEARIDDGWLDSVLLSPAGIVEWVAVAGRVLTRRRTGHQRVDHHRSRTVRVCPDQAQEVQLDGDPIGKAYAMSAAVDPLALVVRVAG